LGKALLVLHSPVDELVGVEHAARLFRAARHPKSYVSLDHADHLLSNPADAAYAGRVIAAWAKRYVHDERQRAVTPRSEARIVVSETTEGAFLNEVVIGDHRFLVDEPRELGGFGAGPSPGDLLAAALGACTAMTLRMYARRNHLPVERVTVEVDHAGPARGRHPEAIGPDENTFECRIRLDGPLETAERTRLLAIASRCPVHRILEASSTITTTIDDGSDEELAQIEVVSRGA
jgi:putative redox protein